MKEICFLIGNINDSGGTERVTTLIANELCKKNYNIVILSLVNGDKPFFELDSRVTIRSLYTRKVSFKKNYLKTIWKIRQFARRYKIETLVVVDSISCVYTIPALIGLNINHICWEHFNFNVDLGVPFRPLGRKLAAKYCDSIVTLTKRDKELWEKNLKNIKATITPISNPTPYVNIEHIPKLEFKTILAMGRLTYQKGFDLLISAWSEVYKNNTDWILRIVGSGEDKEELRNQANLLGVSDSIDFVAVTNDVESYYQTSSFYCLSSRFEGLPMVLLEAQAYGLPVIAFDCDTGPSDVIEHGENGYLVENDNVKKLGFYIDKAINQNDVQYQRMILESRNRSQKFELSNIIKEWVKII